MACTALSASLHFAYRFLFLFHSVILSLVIHPFIFLNIKYTISVCNTQIKEEYTSELVSFYPVLSPKVSSKFQWTMRCSHTEKGMHVHGHDLHFSQHDSSTLWTLSSYNILNIQVSHLLNIHSRFHSCIIKVFIYILLGHISLFLGIIITRNKIAECFPVAGIKMYWEKQLKK